MRRTWIIAVPLLVALVLLIGIGAGACGGGEITPPPGEEETAPPPAEEEEAPPAEGEEAAPPPEEEEEVTPTPSKPQFTSDDGRIEFALDNVERTKVWPAELRMSELEGSVPKEGYDFIVVYVVIVRITDGHVDSGTGSILIDDEGGEYQGYRGLQCSWTTVGVVPYERFELPEGSTGRFIYEVPENMELVKLKLAYLFFESWSESGEKESVEERYIDIILP